MYRIWKNQLIDLKISPKYYPQGIVQTYVQKYTVQHDIPEWLAWWYSIYFQQCNTIAIWQTQLSSQFYNEISNDINDSQISTSAILSCGLNFQLLR